MAHRCSGRRPGQGHEQGEHPRQEERNPRRSSDADHDAAPRLSNENRGILCENTKRISPLFKGGSPHPIISHSSVKFVSIQPCFGFFPCQNCPDFVGKGISGPYGPLSSVPGDRRGRRPRDAAAGCACYGFGPSTSLTGPPQLSWNRPIRPANRVANRLKIGAATLPLTLPYQRPAPLRRPNPSDPRDPSRPFHLNNNSRSRRRSTIRRRRRLRGDQVLQDLTRQAGTISSRTDPSRGARPRPRAALTRPFATPLPPVIPQEIANKGVNKARRNGDRQCRRPGPRRPACFLGSAQQGAPAAPLRLTIPTRPL